MASALLMLASFSIATASSNSGITYHGRILKSDGTPLEGKTVQFKMQVRSPGNESCLLYEEVQTLNMQGSSGVFSISLNDGTGSRDDSSGILFDNVFSNRTGYTFVSGACVSGMAYTPNSSDGRSFVVSFKDEDMQAYEPLPAQPVNFAPIAIQAKQIAGFGPANLLRVDDTAAASTTVMNSAQLANLMAIANGTGYVASGIGGAGLPVFTAAPTTPVAGDIWYNSSTNSLQYYTGATTQTLGTSSGGTGTVTSITAGNGLSGGTITASGTLALANFGTAGTYYKVMTDATGRVSSGTTTLSESDLPTISTAGKVSGSALTSGTIAGSTAVNSTGAITTTGTITGANVTATTLSANSLRLFNAANTFKATLTVPALTADYSLIFPMTAGTNGYVLMTDGTGNLSWTSPGGAPSGTAGGDLSGTYPNPTVAKLSGTAITISSLASGNFLRYNGSAWVNANLSASDMPSLASGQTGILPIANGGTGTSTGSITGTGALAFTAGGSNQNVALTPSGTGSTLLGGKVGIGTTSPAAQLQVANDILAGTKVSVGSSSYADLNLTSNGTIYQNGGDPFSRIQSTGSGNARIELQSNGPSAGATDAGHESGRVDFGGYTGSVWVNQAASVKGVAESTWTGTSNPMALTFSTTAGTAIAEHMRVTSAGNVGIGTTSPASLLTVFGGANSIRTQFNASSYGVALSEDSSSNFHLNVGGGDKIFVTAGGFVGVGTASPAGKLDIEGAGNVVFGAANVGIGTASPAVSLDLGSRTDAIALPKGATEPAGAAAGWIRYNTATPAVEYYNGTAWVTLSSGGSGSYVSSTNGSVSGGFTVSSGGESVTGGLNNNSGGVTNAGSITGVGTNVTGSGAMTVAAGGTAQNLTLASSTSGAVNVGSGNGTSLSVLDGGASTVDYVTLKGAAAGASPVIGTAGSDTNISLSFAPKGSGSSNFTSGYVGIGTTSAANQLDVRGATGLTVRAVPTGVAKFSLVQSDTNGTYMNDNYNFVAFGAATAVNSGTAAEYMRVAAGGNVGIGTTSPGKKLEISQGVTPASGVDAALNMRLYNTDSSGTLTAPGIAGIGFGNSSTRQAIVGGTYGNDFLDFYTSGAFSAPRVRIDSNGNVGIGTTSPGAAIDIQKTDLNTTNAINLFYSPNLTANSNAYLIGNYDTVNLNTNFNETGWVWGQIGRVQTTTGNTGSIANMMGLMGNVYHNGNQNITGGLIGLQADADNSGTGTAIEADGATVYARNAAAGTITTAYGLRAQIYNAGSGTITTGSALSAAISNTGSGVITNSYGLNIGSIAGTNHWSIYSTDATSPSYFAGNIGIGTNSPAVSLDLGARTDAIALPKGATEPTGALAGWIRYNTSTPGVEYYSGSAWVTLASGGGSYVSSTGGTVSGGFTVSSGGESVTGGLNNNSGGLTNTGSITGVGANITGSSAVAISAGGTAQNLTLSGATTGSVNVGNGDGTSLSVLDGGASTVDYIAVKGSAAGGSPAVSTGGSDSNINLTLGAKGTGSIIVPSASNYVGIGTSTPGSTLDVYNATTAGKTTSNALNAYNYITNNQGFTTINGGNFTVATQQLTAATSINGVSGTVNNNSLGTTINGGNFTVNNTVTYPTTVNGVQGTANNSNSGGYGAFNGGSFNTTISAAGATIASASGVTAQVANNSSSTITNAYGLYSGVTNSGTITNSYGLYISPVAGTNKWGVYENSGGANYMAGNLGIGTAPTAISLTASGDISSSRVYPSGGSVTYPSYAFNVSGNGNQMGMFYIAQNVFGFSTNSTERMRIDSSGNVGIGTTSATSTLTVAGTVQSTSGGVKFPDGSTQATASGSVAVRYYANSTTAVPSGSFSGAIAFAVKEYDLGNNFNGTTFTAPYAGIYQLCSSVQVSTTATSWELDVFKNSTRYHGFSITPSGTITTGCTVVQLSASDTLDVRTNQSGAAMTTTANNIWTWITITKM